MPPSPASRPLDALAIAVTVGLCLSWGFNNVAIKFAIHDIPPLIQSSARSVLAAILVGAWTQIRGIPLFKRDSTLPAGILAGVLFALEFLLIYRGLVWTTATRAVLFLYLAPFFVVIGSRWLIPGDRFELSQWLGLILSFAGIAIAFGLPTPATDPHQALGDVMMVGAAAAWAATTLTIKASTLNRISAEKTLLYQLVVSAPLLGVGALVFGEHIDAVPSAAALGAFAYQTVWVVSVTFAVWFALIVRYSAARLSVFTLLVPLFGVAAGHLVLNEPLTPAFALAVGLVAGGSPPRQPAQVRLYAGGSDPHLGSRTAPKDCQNDGVFRPRRKAPNRRRESRQCDSRRRCARCRAVDDQYRYRRRRRDGAAGGGARPSRF
jgi:drug/metabolite transporter (DMT)-like permease